MRNRVLGGVVALVALSIVAAVIVMWPAATPEDTRSEEPTTAQQTVDDPQLPKPVRTNRGPDVLDGFRAGADDYVTKPFSVAQLVARVRALLRRLDGPPATQAEAFEFGPWQVDPAALTGTRPGQAVDFTRREVDMLALLVREHGRIVSRRLLLREVWQFENPEGVETRTVDMHVAKLRKKIDAGTEGSLIQTVRGEGYRYR